MIQLQSLLWFGRFEFFPQTLMLEVWQKHTKSKFAALSLFSEIHKLCLENLQIPVFKTVESGWKLKKTNVFQRWAQDNQPLHQNTYTSTSILSPMLWSRYQNQQQK